MTLQRHPDSPLLDYCPDSLPASVYFDPAWYARENAAIWAKNWVYVGRKADAICKELNLSKETTAAEIISITNGPSWRVL